MSIAPLTPVYAMPTGVDRLGFPSYAPLPAGVPNPPNAWREAQELQTVRQLNFAAHQNPQAAQFTEYLSEHGGWDIWMDMARQYRHAAGFVRGWMGTGLLVAAMGATALKSQIAKRSYDRLRPYQVDGAIQPIGKLPKDAGYPSGHSSSAYAAATVLSHLWPARAQEFGWWARQTALSRVHAGVHFPSDVQMGAQLGIRTGMAAASILY
jgi:membrane-associated phospholipid phosphatase